MLHYFLVLTLPVLSHQMVLGAAPVTNHGFKGYAAMPAMYLEELKIIVQPDSHFSFVIE